MTLREGIGIVAAVGLGVSLVPTARADVTPATGTSRLIVELVPGADVNEINADYGTATIAAITGRNIYLLALPQVYSIEGYGEFLADDPRVEKAEADNDCLAPEAVDGDTQPIFFYVPPAEYGQQYAPDLLNIEAAHQWATGTGTVVAVLDTGVDSSHPLLAGTIEPGGYNFVDGNIDTSDVGSGLDQDGDGLIDELVGHGTFIAGIVVTMAPNASILPVRVLDSEGFSDVFRLVQGIYHAVDNGVDVIHLGLGTRSHNHILRDAIAEARAEGIVVVAAAGNDDREHPVQMPAGEDTVIGVSSTDADDVRSDFTNYGQYISLSAPGRDIVSAMPGGLYALSSGTSLSSAFVAGTAALLRSHDPLATPVEIESRLLSRTQPIDDLNPGYEGLLGAGRLDAAAAINPTNPNDGIMGFGLRGDPGSARWAIELDRVATDLLILLGEDGKTHGFLYSRRRN